MTTTREQRALDRLIADERSQPPSDRDWDRIEEALMVRIARGSRPPRRRLRELVYTGLGLAAAAALALLAAKLLQSEPPRTAAASQEARERIGESAREAAPVVARDEPDTSAGSEGAGQAGRAHWTLDPGSVARVRREGATLVLELDSGSVDVEVGPGPEPETFAVAAGDVRVTVHGTEFRVEHRGETVDVSVWEGVVSVAAKNEPHAVRLSAPAGKRFVEGKLSAHAEPAHSRPLPAGRARSALPVEPSISEVEAGVSRLQAAAQSCFAQHTSAKGGVQVSVRTSVLLYVHPDGSVAIQGFDPPLHPSVDACTRAAASGVRIAASQRGIELTRALDLKR